MKLKFDTATKELLARYHVAQMVLADLKAKGQEERALSLYKNSTVERNRVADKVLLAMARQAVEDREYCQLMIKVAEELTAMVDGCDKTRH